MVIDRNNTGVFPKHAKRFAIVLRCRRFRRAYFQFPSHSPNPTSILNYICSSLPHTFQHPLYIAHTANAACIHFQVSLRNDPCGHSFWQSRPANESVCIVAIQYRLSRTFLAELRLHGSASDLKLQTLSGGCRFHVPCTGLNPIVPRSYVPIAAFVYATAARFNQYRTESPRPSCARDDRRVMSIAIKKISTTTVLCMNLVVPEQNSRGTIGFQDSARFGELKALFFARMEEPADPCRHK